jgi:hypothetical protein
MATAEMAADPGPLRGVRMYSFQNSLSARMSNSLDGVEPEGAWIVLLR